MNSDMGYYAVPRHLLEGLLKQTFSEENQDTFMTEVTTIVGPALTPADVSELYEEIPTAPGTGKPPLWLVLNSLAQMDWSALKSEMRLALKHYMQAQMSIGVTAPTPDTQTDV